MPGVDGSGIGPCATVSQDSVGCPRGHFGDCRDQSTGALEPHGARGFGPGAACTDPGAGAVEQDVAAVEQDTSAVFYDAADRFSQIAAARVESDRPVAIRPDSAVAIRPNAAAPQARSVAPGSRTAAGQETSMRAKAEPTLLATWMKKRVHQMAHQVSQIAAEEATALVEDVGQAVIASTEAVARRALALGSDRLRDFLRLQNRGK